MQKEPLYTSLGYTKRSGVLCYDPSAPQAATIKFPVAIPCAQCLEAIPPHVDACLVEAATAQQNLFPGPVYVHADCKIAWLESVLHAS